MSKNSFKIDLPVSEIARLVGGRLEGDDSWIVRGANSLEEAGPEDISFFASSKYAAAARKSQAGCLLLPLDVGELPSAVKSKIYVEDPQYALAQVLIEMEARTPKFPALVDERACVHYEARLGSEVSVGPFALIDRGAIIGEHTIISPQCHIGTGVRVGRHCRIYPHVVIRENCVIGDRTIIHSGTVIGADGFGFSTDRKSGKHRKIPQIGNVIIGQDVEIGANVTIDRAALGSTMIGDGSKIDNLVQIAHNVQIGRDCLIISQVGISGSTQIGHRVILAGQAGLAGHLQVGDEAIVMAQSGVMSDIEKGAVVFGSPARPRKEAFKLQALYGRLPKIFETIKDIKSQRGDSFSRKSNGEKPVS